VTLSLSEACPMIFNEAKILQIPIVSSDFGSAKEFINNGVDGIISPIEEFPEVIYQMMSNAMKYQNIKLNLAKFIYINDVIKCILINLFIF